MSCRSKGTILTVYESKTGASESGPGDRSQNLVAVSRQLDGGIRFVVIPGVLRFQNCSTKLPLPAQFMIYTGQILVLM